MKYRNKKVVSVSEWDNLVRKIYGKRYSFQQQDDCRSRGVVSLEVPDQPDDYENDRVVEKVNGPEMGVSFAAWLARDPKQKLADEPDDQAQWMIDLWWDRNFYPDLRMVANDLHAKGLLEPGDYLINVDW